ncbi:MAG: HRDC domain-containing protein [Elusimicrobia bacterium]|nr:HRDC domain-containing protein [Elusimicrobiota bacterium]
MTAREHLEEVAQEIHRTRRAAVDIESNSFYVYRERVCLVQVSTIDTDYVIDPLAIRDFSSMGPVFADPGTEKVFHAGEYDVACLKRDYAFSFANVFDTMIASRLLGFKELGLAAAIERHFGAKLSKKLQRADWGRRPLTDAQIRYAQLDTHYLLRLADIQLGLLKQRGLEEEAAEAFAKLARSAPVQRDFDPEGFWRLSRGLTQPDGARLAVLKELYLLREREAESRNRATFRVMPDEVLPRLAMALPKDPAALRGVRGMTPYLLDNYGPAILAAVKKGLAAAPISPDSREKPKKRDPRMGRLFEKLRLWRKTKAQEAGVDPVDVLPTADLKAISRLAFVGGDPLGPLSLLKRSRYGAEILKLVRGR